MLSSGAAVLGIKGAVVYGKSARAPQIHNVRSRSPRALNHHRVRPLAIHDGRHVHVVLPVGLQRSGQSHLRPLQRAKTALRAYRFVCSLLYPRACQRLVNELNNRRILVGNIPQLVVDKRHVGIGFRLAPRRNGSPIGILPAHLERNRIQIAEVLEQLFLVGVIPILGHAVDLAANRDAVSFVLQLVYFGSPEKMEPRSAVVVTHYPNPSAILEFRHGPPRDKPDVRQFWCAEPKAASGWRTPPPCHCRRDQCPGKTLA